MSTPTCPLCGNQHTEKHFSQRGHNLVVCQSCELFFIDPYPTDATVVHGRVVEYAYEDLEILDAERQYANEVHTYKRIYPMIAAECEGIGSVLDVGCGTGHLLERLGSIPGLYRAGIELNSARVERARQVAGCDIYQVPIEEFKSDRKFDAITMINVLSHIPSLDGLFHSTRSLLARDGKLILKVGEFSRNVHKSDIIDWGLPDHLHFLGLKTIDVIAAKYGYKIIKHSRTQYSSDFFSRENWTIRGRSSVRNAIKTIVLSLPFALELMARTHLLLRGNRIYSSLIVLSPAE